MAGILSSLGINTVAQDDKTVESAFIPNIDPSYEFLGKPVTVTNEEKKEVQLDPLLGLPPTNGPIPAFANQLVEQFKAARNSKTVHFMSTTDSAGTLDMRSFALNPALLKKRLEVAGAWEGDDYAANQEAYASYQADMAALDPSIEGLLKQVKDTTDKDEIIALEAQIDAALLPILQNPKYQQIFSLFPHGFNEAGPVKGVIRCPDFVYDADGAVIAAILYNDAAGKTPVYHEVTVSDQGKGQITKVSDEITDEDAIKHLKTLKTSAAWVPHSYNKELKSYPTSHGFEQGSKEEKQHHDEIAAALSKEFGKEITAEQLLKQLNKQKESFATLSEEEKLEVLQIQAMLDGNSAALPTILAGVVITDPDGNNILKTETDVSTILAIYAETFNNYLTTHDEGISRTQSVVVTHATEDTKREVQVNGTKYTASNLQNLTMVSKARGPLSENYSPLQNEVDGSYNLDTAKELAVIMAATLKNGTNIVSPVGIATDYCVKGSATDLISLVFPYAQALQLAQGLTEGKGKDEAIQQIHDNFKAQGADGSVSLEDLLKETDIDPKALKANIVLHYNKEATGAIVQDDKTATYFEVLKTSLDKGYPLDAETQKQYFAAVKEIKGVNSDEYLAAAQEAKGEKVGAFVVAWDRYLALKPKTNGDIRTLWTSKAELPMWQKGHWPTTKQPDGTGYSSLETKPHGAEKGTAAANALRKAYHDLSSKERKDDSTQLVRDAMDENGCELNELLELNHNSTKRLSSSNQIKRLSLRSLDQDSTPAQK